MPDAPIRVIIADDHPILLRGLREMFEDEPGFEVAECCRDGHEALAAVRRTRADVIVLDLRMPGLGGFDVIRAITSERLKCRVVLLTATLRDTQVTEVMQLGVKGLVLKESPSEVLLDCVRHVQRGEEWIDRAALTRALDHARQAGTMGVPGAALTPRELEIVRMLAEGLRNREIADKLFITEGTVKLHLHNAYEKLGVNGRLELVLYAQERGLV